MMVAYCHRSEITLHIIHVDLDIENSDNKFMLISPHNKFIKNVSSLFSIILKMRVFLQDMTKVKGKRGENRKHLIWLTTITKNTSCFS